ncbi:DNA protecting protein DprA [Haloprofundus marisrubri]|uniref:DNA protecting protein DprA n=1 Tax=Haloprofundus marisrubri TaxID=1514971 RepID=A0A0W1RDU3_9EURY|nr:DNA-processing protein DprA [Haloprofundus marisrubri]KTG11435.1 DNA protecting protein DprA [Haloprofundus marisrubri]
MRIEDLALLVALTEVDGIGDKRALELYREFETKTEFESSSRSDFDQFHYVDNDTHQQLQELGAVIDEYRERFERYQSEGTAVIGIDDERYPASLRHHHAPLVLYTKGNLSRLDDRLVSVSGSRETNEDGRGWIREVAGEMAAEDYTIVSGGAAGTDTAAHKGALEETGSTIVVLPTGVNNTYPEENTELFAEIVDAGGLLLSHRPPEEGPTRHAFLDRNKTISALSPGTVIVATDGSGGTMAQYKTAIKQGRQVFVPDSSLGIEPSGGVEEIRSDGSTAVVSTSFELMDRLQCLPPLEHGNQLTGESDDDGQMSLDDWG